MELERVISEAEQIGSVVVLGDFNAHLGVLGGYRGIGEANQQGVLLEDFLRRCDLNAVSLGYLASGPGYTYEWDSVDCGGGLHLNGCRCDLNDVILLYTLS